MLREVPPHSPRYALAHIDNLPFDSATAAEMRGGQKFRGWDVDRYMAAQSLDVQKSLAYMYLKTHVKEGTKLSVPEPTPIPDESKKTPADSKPGSFAFLARAHANAVRAKRDREGR